MEEKLSITKKHSPFSITNNFLSTRLPSHYFTQGHTRVLQRLLLDPRVDAASQDNEPLRTAAKDGAVSILTALLAHARTSGIDPSACENMAVRDASRKGHVECVALLVGDPRFSAQVELYGAGFVDRMVHNAAVARKKLGKRKVYARLAGDVGSGMIGDHHEHGGDEKIYHHQANRRSSSISATSDANGSTYKSNSHRNSMNYIDIGGDNDVMRDLDSSHPRSLRSATTSTDVAVLDDSAMDIDMMAVDKMQDGKTLFDQPPDKMAEFEEAYVKVNKPEI